MSILDQPATYTHAFKIISGWTLIITGVAKIISAAGVAQVLSTPDPLIGIKLSTLLLMVGVVEICIGIFSLFTARIDLVLVIIGILALNLVIYRIGLWAIDWKEPCHCLGIITQALNISVATADRISKVFLVWLLFGSVTCLAIQLKTAKIK